MQQMMMQLVMGPVIAMAAMSGKGLVSARAGRQVMPMTREIVDSFCAALPGAEWASEADGAIPSWKVGDKMFACIGHRGEGVSVKTPDVETAALLIDMGRAERAKYFHRSWVRLDWNAVEPDELRDRLQISYDIVRSSLSKKLQAALG